jgi:hypothetical protein
VKNVEDAEMPVSGRSQPRPGPLPEGFAHDVRVHGARDGYGVVVYCDPCEWSVRLDDGHTLGQLAELQRQHCGPQECGNKAGGLTCTLPAGHYAGHHAKVGLHSITWPADEPFGTETEPGR